MARVEILVGEAGSGKSEIAINLAIQEAKLGHRVMIIDLDIVNPYFCIRDITSELEDNYGIHVVSSKEQFRNAELMVLPPNAVQAILNEEYKIIIDVGGDCDGARALSQYKKHIINQDYDISLVVNTFRPRTSNYNDLLSLIKKLEEASQLKVTSYISNSNLLVCSTMDEVISGHKVIKELSDKTNIPLKYTVISRRLEGEIEINKIQNPLIIDNHIKLPWNN